MNLSDFSSRSESLFFKSQSFNTNVIISSLWFWCPTQNVLGEKIDAAALYFPNIIFFTYKVLMWVENNTRCPAFMNPSRPHSLSPTQRLFLSSHPFLRLSIFSCVLSQKLSISIEPSLIISSLCCPFLRRLPQSRTNTLTLPLVFRRMKPGGDMLLTVNRPSLFQQLLITIVRFSWFDNVK